MAYSCSPYGEPLLQLYESWLTAAIPVDSPSATWSAIRMPSCEHSPSGFSGQPGMPASLCHTQRPERLYTLCYSQAVSVMVMVARGVVGVADLCRNGSSDRPSHCRAQNSKGLDGSELRLERIRSSLCALQCRHMTLCACRGTWAPRVVVGS